VASWIRDKAIDEDINQELPRLRRGCPHAWSPAWLQISQVITVAPKWTFDASSTPRVGLTTKARSLSPMDVAQLRTAMAATLERAKQEDPKELRRQLGERDRRIRELERATPVPAVASVREKRVEVPVLTGKQLQAFERTAARVEKTGTALIEVGGQFVTIARELLAVAKRAAGGNGRTAEIRNTATRPRPSVVRPSPPRRDPPASAEGLSRSQQRILNALAWLETLGLPSADKTQVALLADQSPTSGGFFNNLGRLRSAGLIDYPAPSVVALTDAGRDAAAPVDVPQTSEELQRQLFARLSGSQVKILEHLIARYPEAVAKDDLAAAAGQSATSGGYFNNLGRLRSLGLIDYPVPGQAVAQPVLFLEAQ
jgi:hypothetical protein